MIKDVFLTVFGLAISIVIAGVMLHIVASIIEKFYHGDDEYNGDYYE